MEAIPQERGDIVSVVQGQGPDQPGGASINLTRILAQMLMASDAEMYKIWKSDLQTLLHQESL